MLEKILVVRLLIADSALVCRAAAVSPCLLPCTDMTGKQNTVVPLPAATAHTGMGASEFPVSAWVLLQVDGQSHED